MKRYTKTIIGLPGRQEIKMEECKGGAWVLWTDVLALLGDDWGVCNRCGTPELVSNLYRVILADDLTLTTFGFTGGLPDIDDKNFSIVLLLCPHCRASWTVSTQKWFSKRSE